MQKHKNNFQDKNGNAHVGASVTVYDVGTTTEATLYEDDESTTKSNPLTTDAYGAYSFKVADGDYDLKFEKSGITTTYFLDKQSLDRAGIKASLFALTGTSFDFIQDATPSATAADEWWLKTDTGGAYVSTASGTGNWVLSYQVVLLSNGVYTLNQGDVKLGNNYLLQSQTIQDLQPFQALYLPGDAYVTVPHNTELDLTVNGATLIFPSFMTTTDYSGAPGMIMRKRIDAEGYIGQILTDNKFNVFLGGSGATSALVSTDSVVNDGKWHRPIAKLDSSGNLTLFIDGVKQVETDVLAGMDSLSNATDLRFGTNDGATAQFFTGTLGGEPVILNRLLTDEAVIALSSNPLMAIDPIDEGGSNVAQNVSNCENGLNGLGVANQYDTFSGVSATGFTAIKTTASGVTVCGTNDEINAVKGKKIRKYFNIVLNSGVMPDALLVPSLGSGSISDEGIVSLSAGINAVEFTANTTDPSAAVEFRSLDGDVTNFTVSVLDVTALGCTERWKPQDIIDGFMKASMNGNHGAITGGTIVNKSGQLVEESGTFTPTVLLGGASTGITQSTTYGSYVKLGSIVIASLTILFDKGSTSTGDVTVTGLPYTVKTETNYFPPAYGLFNRIGAAGEVTVAYCNQGTKTFSLGQQPQSTAVPTNTDDTDIVATGSTATIAVETFYVTDE